MAVHVGTSGWSYQDWRGAFYPARGSRSGWLGCYASRFATVEINATFYGLTSEDTLAAWRDSVPDDFVFAVKASRYLTHVRRLRDPGPPVGLLVERTAVLGARRGPVLLQLPPDMTAEAGRLDETLAAFGGACPVAVELRHPSWECDRVREVLERHGAALCLTDRRGPGRPWWRTADWGYVRFHAGRADPEPCYGRAALDSWAARLADTWPAGADVYAYFNNDRRACAPRDARQLALACARHGLAPSRVPAAGEARLAGG